MSEDLARLTARERQVANLVKEGLSDRQVAERLHVSRRTAEWHVQQILVKLDLRSRAQLAATVAAAEARRDSVSTLHTAYDLPLQLSAFVGRRAELAQLASVLADSRLLTLSGPGGVGKTRLALEVASRSLQLFPSGAWFVDLAAVRQPALVPRAVATVLHVTELSKRPLPETLVQHIRDQQLLLLLDNCEHVIDDVARLAEQLLRACSRTTVLATSREPLRVPGEMVWRVAPLAIPETQRRYSIHELAQVEAVGLFLERAQHVSPGLELSIDNAADIVELCRRLDGVPLGLELAAARASMMTPAEMLERLPSNAASSGLGSRTAAARHQTIDAAIQWSYDLLAPAEATLFRRLPLFAGTFNLASVEAVGGGYGLEGSALNLLSSLVDKSLVIPERRSTNQTRYRLLDTVRRYALKQLEASAETKQVSEAYVQHYLAFAEAAKPRLLGDAVSALEELDTERDNLRAAFREAIQLQTDAALRLAVALFQYWNIRGHIVEGRELIERGLSISAGDAATRSLGEALAAHLAWYADDWTGATAHAEAAIAIGREAEPGEGLSIGLWALGMLKLNRRNFTAAIELFNESGTTAEVCGADKTLVYYPMSGFYTVGMMRGEFPAARAVLSEVLALFDARRRPFLHCVMRCIAALMEGVAGDREQAATHLEAGVDLARRLGANYWGGWAVRAGAYLAAAQGDWERCWQLYGASEALRDYTHFAVRVNGRKADDLLLPARDAVDAETVQVLVEAGRSLLPGDAYNLALTVAKQSR